MPSETPEWMSSSLLPSSSNLRFDDDEHELHEGEMGFFDHLTELRSRIIKALLGLVVGAALAGIFWQQIIEGILVKPARDAGMKLISIVPMGQVTFVIQVV